MMDMFFQTKATEEDEEDIHDLEEVRDVSDAMIGCLSFPICCLGLSGTCQDWDFQLELEQKKEAKM